MDIAPDDQDALVKSQKVMYKWDRKKKKYLKTTLGNEIKEGKIRNESGKIIRKASKKNIYEDWKNKTKKRIPLEGEMESERGRKIDNKAYFDKKKRFQMQTERKQNEQQIKQQKQQNYKDELKSKEQIQKQRKIKDRRKEWAQKGSKKDKNEIKKPRVFKGAPKRSQKVNNKKRRK
eukprot:TRINITY_DN3126_c0_g1_i1.p2 TRINITY_DN3126_c0_g1~~TRINITY_DN3126_c0_g1_i1.p2  ORF type:complete len:176 (-),score=94.20 TRINITY_DN3126_c0_g1_i1:110-637(-)